MYRDPRSRWYGFAVTLSVHGGLLLLASLAWLKAPVGGAGKARPEISIFALSPPTSVRPPDRGAGTQARTGLPTETEARIMPLPVAKGAPTLGKGLPSDSVVSGALQAAAARPPSAHGALPIDFQAALLRHIERFRHFPDEARQARQEGTVLIGFVVVRSGALLDFWIDRSSGYPSLDREALATIRRAQPLPHIPDELPEQLQVVLPVSFDLD